MLLEEQNKREKEFKAQEDARLEREDREKMRILEADRIKREQDERLRREEQEKQRKQMAEKLRQEILQKNYLDPTVIHMRDGKDAVNQSVPATIQQRGTKNSIGGAAGMKPKFQQ